MGAKAHLLYPVEYSKYANSVEKVVFILFSGTLQRKFLEACYVIIQNNRSQPIWEVLLRNFISFIF